MARTLPLGLWLLFPGLLPSAAHAAEPCVYSGSMRGYVTCIADQAHSALVAVGALEERLDTMDPVEPTPASRVVYLTDRDGAPPCPDGWVELGAGEIWASDTFVNHQRACEVTGCDVLQLRHRDPPVLCPIGWDEVDYSSAWVSDTRLNYTRTCERCAE